MITCPPRFLRVVLVLATTVALGLSACSSGGGGSIHQTPTPTPTLISIAITPTTLSISAGLTQQLTATGTWSDGSTKNLTNAVTWLSSDQSVATVSNSGLITVKAIGSVTFTATSTSNATATSAAVSGSMSVTVTKPVLASIAISPSPATVMVGAPSPLQLTATGIYTDGSTQDLTSQVSWTAVNPVVASVDTSGQASPLQAGYTAVTATSGTISANTSFTVLATPRYLYLASDAGRDITKMTITPSSGQPRFAGYLATGTVDNIGGNCLTMDPSGTHAYLTSQIIRSGGSGYAGLVTIYAVNASTGTLTAFAGNPYPFSVPLGCLSFTPNGKFAYASSGIENAGNQLAAFAVNSDATLTSENTIAYSQTPTGVSIDPLGKFLYVDVVNVPGGTLGSSALYGYSIDPTTGSLAALDGSPFSLPAGTYGELSFHPSGNFLYISDANSVNTIAQYTVNRQTGAPTAGASYAVPNCMNPHTLQFSPDAAHAYATCSELNAPVVVYAVGSNGTLTENSSTPTGGLPMQMLVDPSGKFLYISIFSEDPTGNNVASNIFSVFSISANGSLSLVSNISGRNNPDTMALIGGSSPVTWTPTSAFIVTAGDDRVTPYAMQSNGTLTAGTSVVTGGTPTMATNLPWGSNLLVADLNGYISPYSISGISLTGNSPFGGNSTSIGGLVIDPAGDRAYGSDPSTGQVYVYMENGTDQWFNTMPSFAAGSGAGPVTLNPSGQTLFIGNQTEKSISLIEPAGAAPIPNVSLTYTPLALAVDPTGNLLFVTGDDGNLHVLFSGGTRNVTPVAEATLPSNMSSIAIDPAANFVYVAGTGGLAGFQYNPSAGTLTPLSINTPVSLSSATGTYVDPSGQFLYVSVSTATTNALYLFTINPAGTLTSYSANPVATPNHATGMLFNAQIQ